MLNPKMQTIFRRQDFTTANIGVKKYMHQASLSMAPLTVPTSVTPMNTPLTPTTPGSSGMPALTRETLALRLRQNWLAKHPVDTPPPSTNTGMDDSLTSLNWLQNLNIMKIPTPTPPASPQPGENALVASHYTPTMQVNPNAVLNMAGNDGSLSPPVIRIKQEPGLGMQAIVAPPRINNFMDVFPPQANSPGLDKIDYKTNPCVKPPYSYATLICMAMKETKKNKITLAGIYNWITENFMYYKVADPSWQNSIRHNLSLNKCFQKVPRRKDEPGKGGFWRINPEYEDMFINGIFKKRRGSTSTREIPLPTPAPPTLKRVRREMEDSSDSSSCEPSTSTGKPAKVPRLTIKQEPGLNTNTDVLDDTIDFNWNSILSADIEVGGVTVKTEDIIDANDDEDDASPITAMSPPPSESSVISTSDDIVFEDFFNNTDFPAELEEPLDFTTGGPLDLSISGNHMRAPEWWEESIMPALTGQHAEPSGLHTPIHGSAVPDEDYAHPWAEDKVDIDNAVAVFDADITHLFDMDNVPSPNLGAPESS